MMSSRWLFCCLLIISCCSRNVSFAQQDYNWFKGWWLYYGIRPDTMRGQSVETDLEITEIKENQYTGIQKIYCRNDTLSQVKRECSGLFTNGDISFVPGKELFRKEPEQAYIWDAYTKYEVEKSYFSISHDKLILHLVAKSADKGFVKVFAYYRDLLPLAFSLRYQLEKRYGSLQLIDANTDTVKVVAPVEPDTNDTTSYVNVLPGSNALPSEIATRQNTLVKTVRVSSPDIQVVLLDDAEIDGDIISLYDNNQLVIDHKTLGKEMIKYTLKADKTNAHHEFTLVAENLGSIPPNTALMRIRAGDKKYEFVVHSNMHENVKVVIDYIDE